jgi:hypothetical protein
MLDKALLWGADEVCDVLGHFGLASGEACVFRGSYSIGVGFLMTTTVLTVWVITILSRKW